MQRFIALFENKMKLESKCERYATASYLAQKYPMSIIHKKARNK